MAIRCVTDDIEISSDDSDEEYIKTKYPVRSSLIRVCKIGIKKVFINFFLALWLLVLCLKHSSIFKVSINLISFFWQIIKV